MDKLAKRFLHTSSSKRKTFHEADGQYENEKEERNSFYKNKTQTLSLFLFYRNYFT